VSQTYAGNPAFDSIVSDTTRALQSAGIDALTATQQAYAHVMGLVAQQAAALAYVEVITVMALVVACLVPLPMIMRRPAKREAVEEVAMH
jgi:DHA2 family multidrug resistance protein